MEDLALEFFEADLVDQPLHAGPELVLTVAVTVEDPEDRLERGEEVLTRREVLQRQGRMRRGTETARHVHTEAGLERSVLALASDGDDAGIVEHGLATVRRAARKVDLELPRESLSQRVAQEVAIGGLGPRGDVEDLVRAGTCKMARLHVANRVTARLAAGEPDRHQLSQEVGDPLQLDVVELEVLPGGDVTPAPAVLVGDVGQHVELARGELARRCLDPDHLVGPALALPVNAVAEPEDTKGVLGQVTVEVPLQLHFELLDVGEHLGVEQGLSVDSDVEHGGLQWWGWRGSRSIPDFTDRN